MIQEQRNTADGPGVAWLRTAIKPLNISPLGIKVAEIMEELFGGIYHWNHARRTDWSNDRYIRCLVDIELATYDFNYLTRLVFMAHRDKVRVSIGPCNFQYLELLFHERCAIGENTRYWEQHPDIYQALAQFERSTCTSIDSLDELASLDETVPTLVLSGLNAGMDRESVAVWTGFDVSKVQAICGVDGHTFEKYESGDTVWRACSRCGVQDEEEVP